MRREIAVVKEARRIVPFADPTAPWSLRGDDIPNVNGITFARRETAEMAFGLTVAEAYTLSHAERRLCKDPFEPHMMTVRWKIVNGLPMTDREQDYMNDQRNNSESARV